METDPILDLVESVTGERHHRIEQDLGHGFVRLDSAEAERRQAQHDVRNVEDMVIELLRNARDAGAVTIFVATSQSAGQRRLVVIDDGAGVPEELQELIFEPRVTSKLDSCHMDRWGVHGRGMALYSIAANSLSASVAASELGRGSSIAVDVDLGRIPERRDQSTLPSLIEEEGRTLFRGPRNIQRIVGEFAVEERKRCTVFLGSPVEVVATLYELGRRLLSPHERSFGDPTEAALLLRPSFAVDPEELCQRSEDLGLTLSTRSARRIIDGELSPLEPFLARLLANPVAAQAADEAPGAKTQTKRSKKPVSARSVARRFSEEDLERFRAQVRTAFDELAASYYLEREVDVTLSQEKGELRLRIPLEEERS